MTQPRTYHFAKPRPLTVELHPQYCDCAVCAPYCDHRADAAISPRAFGLLTIAGVVTGNLIAFAVDPAGSARALAAILGWPL